MVVGSGMNDAEDADKRISGSLMADRRSRDSEGKVYRSNGGERYRQKEEEIKIVKQEEMVERIRCEGRQAGRQARSGTSKQRVQVSCKVISLGRCRSAAEAQKARARERRRGGKGKGEEEGQVGRQGSGSGRGAASKRPRTQWQEEPVSKEWMLSTSPGSVDSRGTILA